MELPLDVLSVSALICERILVEKDEVMSAIRMVDVFYVPEPPSQIPEEVLPVVQIFFLVVVKVKPRTANEHTLLIRLTNTAGETKDMGEPAKIRATTKSGLEDAAAGIALHVQLNVGVKRLGTCYLSVLLDGQEAAKVPFTLLRQPKPAEKNG